MIVYVLRPAADGRSHEVLQLRRAPGRYLAGIWSFPGGRIEPGETAVRAAVRELGEETGLTPADLGRLSFLSHVDVFYRPDADAVWHRPGFVAVVGRDARVRLNGEHTASRWVGRYEVGAAVLWPGERAGLREAFDEHLAGHPADAFRRIDLAGFA